MRRLAIAVLVVLACSCDRSAGEGGSASEPLPDAALVTCEEEGAPEVTPIVRAQADGVHFAVDPPGPGFAFIVREWGGRNAEVGTFVADVAPGTVHVACFGDVGGADAGDDALYAELVVEDPDGVFVPFEPDCAAEGVGASGPGASLGTDPVAAVGGYLLGLRPDDRVERAGYPARTDRAIVRVVRDGSVVAAVGLEPVDGGAWGMVTFTGCPGAGVTYPGYEPPA